MNLSLQNKPQIVIGTFEPSKPGSGLRGFCRLAQYQMLYMPKKGYYVGKSGSMDFPADKSYVAIALVVFAAIFFAFYPSYFTSIDEHTLLKNSLLLHEGQIGEQNPELACRSTIYNQQGYVAAQFFGKSVFLLPFTFFGLDGVMLSGLLIHILNAILLYLILKKLSIDPRFTILYIFMPVMLWEARTLYSELLVLTAFLAAFYFYIKNTRNSNFISGAIFGLAMFVRYEAIAGFAAFSLPLLFSDRKKLLELAAGFIPVVVLIMAFNTYAYSGPLSTGYGAGQSLLLSTIVAAFSTELHTLILYTLLLLLLPPLLLASPFISKERKYLLQFVLLAGAYLILNARFTNFLAFDFSAATTLTARLRYLVPLIGILIIPYSSMLDSAFSKWKLPRNAVFAAALIVLAAGAVFGSAMHSNLTTSRSQTYEQIRSVVPQDALVIGSSDDCIYSLTRDLKRTRYLNIAPVSDIGPTGDKLNLLEKLDNNTYILELRYSNLEDNSGTRQDSIDAERKRIEDFVKNNKQGLSLVFETKEPNSLRIYKWIGG